MLVRIANREDTDQSDLGLHCFFRLFRSATSVQNLRTSTVLMDKMFLSSKISVFFLLKENF